ncbi:MAG: F0F1 ATP synthase subunit epsilon [Nostocoides sp.]
MSLKVEVVAADRTVYTGEATLVSARSVDGDLGIMPGHTPIFTILGPGTIALKEPDGTARTAVVDGGFLSVEHDTVTIVAEHVEVDADSSRA